MDELSRRLREVKSHHDFQGALVPDDGPCVEGRRQLVMSQLDKLFVLVVLSCSTKGAEVGHCQHTLAPMAKVELFELISTLEHISGRLLCLAHRRFCRRAVPEKRPCLFEGEGTRLELADQEEDKKLHEVAEATCFAKERGQTDDDALFFLHLFTQVNPEGLDGFRFSSHRESQLRKPVNIEEGKFFRLGHELPETVLKRDFRFDQAELT